MDEQMKNILRYALILFLIAAVVAGLLAGVNLLTKDTIAQNRDCGGAAGTWRGYAGRADV